VTEKYFNKTDKQFAAIPTIFGPPKIGVNEIYGKEK
jgi:hypothetical protein